uniref:Protein SDA1 n=1 Tax=Eptatretus burgeri TaxID=7764 RepID=A0A8C4WT06_EPTBU
MCIITSINRLSIVYLSSLNAIREICARCQLAMNEDLLQDLSQYKSHRNKNVSTAARSIIHLFRTINPKLLHQKDRGKPSLLSAEHSVLKYGENTALNYIHGAEVLGEELKVAKRTSSEQEQNSPGEEDTKGRQEVTKEEQTVWQTHTKRSRSSNTSTDAILAWCQCRVRPRQRSLPSRVRKAQSPVDWVHNI